MAEKNISTPSNKEIRKCSLRCSEITLERTGIRKFQSAVTACHTELAAITNLEVIRYILMLSTEVVERLGAGALQL